MVHLDLFSGIGGFAFAVDQVWDNVEHIFCDNDKFCQQVLKKHWPEAKIYDDIRNITNADFQRSLERQLKIRATKRNETQSRSAHSIDLLTGGFPCQPFSAAGLRRGTADDRHLWPEMLRVIRLTKPQWVIAENVRGLLTWDQGLVFEQVCADLETEGYAVQPFIIPAVAVNAPHRRDRIWFVANRQVEGLQQGRETRRQIKARDARRRRPAHNSIDDAKDPLGFAGRGGSQSSRQVLERQSTQIENAGPSWQTHWLEVATELCGVDDGLPAELDGFKLSKPQHRKERLKSLGNAIVPQVAMEIMKEISIAF